VGDIFGAPLALEALIAFFMESTFVGLWIFGWNKLSRKVHLLMIYLTAIGTTISAIFILAANSWMQNPVGAKLVAMPDGNYRAELTDFIGLIKNPFFLVTFPHVIGGALMLAGGLVAGVGGWWLAKGRHAPTRATDGANVVAKPAPDEPAWRAAARFGAWFVLVASLCTMLVGHLQGQIEAKYQPMKLAASEGLHNESGTFVLLAPQRADGTDPWYAVPVPGLLSFLAFNNFDQMAPGMAQLTQPDAYQQVCSTNGETCFLTPKDSSEAGALAQSLSATQGAGGWTWQGVVIDGTVYSQPSMLVSFYSFRMMLLFGALGLIISIVMLVKTRGEEVPKATKFWTAMMIALPLLPMFASSFGWILTEMGRQPWIVYGILPTSAGVSPLVSAGEILTSMILYTLIYAVVAVIVVKLFLKVIHEGLSDGGDAPDDQVSDKDAILHFAY
jgi:cytochrome d ubiquinol oxidase subunit I